MLQILFDVAFFFKLKFVLFIFGDNNWSFLIWKIRKDLIFVCNVILKRQLVRRELYSHIFTSTYMMMIHSTTPNPWPPQASLPWRQIARCKWKSLKTHKCPYESYSRLFPLLLWKWMPVQSMINSIGLSFMYKLITFTLKNMKTKQTFDKEYVDEHQGPH